MKGRSFIFFLSMPVCAVGNCQSHSDSVIRQKGIYGSFAIAHIYFWPPLINRSAANPMFPVVDIPVFTGGYRFAPRVRGQLSVTYVSFSLNTVSDERYYGENRYTLDDRGRFLLSDFQLKGYPLPSRFRIQPYLGAGIMVRWHWLQQNHQVYYKNTDSMTQEIHAHINGILPYWTIDPGIQIRAQKHVEIFAEYNFRELFGEQRRNPIWQYWYFPGFSFGLTYHFVSKSKL